MLFEGLGFNGKTANLGLWVTDGTSAGTSELTPAGTASGGVLASNDPDFTVLGGKVLFEGRDSNNNLGLWVTDGTSGGTSELVSGAASSGGLFAGSLNPDFTVLGSKVLFAGLDSAGRSNLWVTDGTLAGTSELAVQGAGAAHGLLDVLEPDFTVLGNKALFYGSDNIPTSGFGLWATDGTAAGTSELVGGFVGGITDITVFGSEALFSGNDQLSVTDGTAAGTSELTTGSTGLYPASITVLVASAPAPTGLALAPSSDSGVKGDDITNVTKPTITGDGVADDTVTLDDGTTAIGSAVVAAGGTWSVTLAGALAPGVHTLTATETSATSETSAISAPLKLTIKTSAPHPRG